MKQFGIILKYELKNYLKNKLFVGITIFLVVAISIVMFLPNIISAFESDDEGTESLPVMLVQSDDETLLALVEEYFSAVFTDYNVVRANSFEEFEESIVSQKAECGFVVESADECYYYVNDLSMSDSNVTRANTALLEVYRANAMMELGITMEEAMEIMSVSIKSETKILGKDQVQNFIYTYVMIIALYVVILLYGQMIASNVATEKSSRAMELLITSAKPTSLMFGKILSSCIMGFSQLLLVFGTALVLFNINREQFSNPIIASVFDMPPELFGFMLVFFVLGFLVYAFLYGAVGSTVSKLEDINTSVMPITFLFIIAFMVSMMSMTEGDVNSTMMQVCSYIPFTSPMVMFTRICMSTINWYEIVASIAILVVSVVGIGIASAKIYRVGVLLYGTPQKLPAIIKMVFTKE